MAKVVAVWGIDVGDTALKALRCVPHEDGNRITAVAFDYIEYPKLLSQPDADRVELVRDALKQFLSRNSVRGDRVVISVSGQAGLARFIKLPPVETSKIFEIVKYEAKQQIPFALTEVVWDYQQLSGGLTTEGFSLDSEVGLFAMKREQVYRFLKPFDDVDVEVDIVQLTPEALYNYVVFDQLTNLPSPEEYDPDNPPDSVAVVSLGTESTDLVVTNGFRVWQRSVPVGGNHFTKALVKDLKMNFATAEHLKRNAAQAEDPKALFQAMKPVFNELLTETQRSLAYYKNNVDRKAKISRVLVLGNAIRLPGLQKFLAQNLGHDLTKVDAFRGLTGSGIIDQPAFKDNLPAFGVCFGLALQGLKKSRFQTNLLPPEIITYRKIRAKKPWAALAAALLLVGFALSYFQWANALNTVSLAPSPQDPNLTFEAPKREAERVVSQAREWREQFEAAKNKFLKTDEVGQSIVQNVQNRDTWLRFLRAVNLCLPRNEGTRSNDIAQRNEIKIDKFECRWISDLDKWYVATSVWRKEEGAGQAEAPAAQPAPDTNPQPILDANGMPLPPAPPPSNGPTGPGWVFQITGHHYRNWPNDPLHNQGANYVRRTLLKNLAADDVPVPAGERGENDPSRWPVKAMGIGFPVLIGSPTINWDYMLKVAEAEGAEAIGPNAQQRVKEERHARYDFKVQFCWQPFKKPEAQAQPAPNAAAAMQP